MKKKSNNILVIGGSGFIGSHTADFLSESGHRVTILDKVFSPFLRNDQKMIVGDLMKSDVLEKSMKGIQYIYYFAGISDISESKLNPYKTIDTNIMGLTKSLESAVKNKIKRFIYASTMYVYSSHGSFYRATKQAAEILIETYSENYKIEYVFLRYGSIYGPRSQQWNGIREFAQQVIDKGFIRYSGNGSEVREYIHVKDAAKLSVKILDSKYKNKAVTITGHQAIKVSDIIAMIFEVEGKNVKVKYLDNLKKTFHYGNTPYRYTPKASMKITPSEFVDLGQGLLNIIEEIHNKK